MTSKILLISFAAELFEYEHHIFDADSNKERLNKEEIKSNCAFSAQPHLT